MLVVDNSIALAPAGLNRLRRIEFAVLKFKYLVLPFHGLPELIGRAVAIA